MPTDIWSSETLLALEREHLVQLGIWSCASFALGGILLILVRACGARAPLLWHFALQTALWGAAELVLVALWWRGLDARDFAGASRFALVLRLAIGAEVACIVFGATLAIAGWTITRRLAALGAGAAVVVQAAALLVLDASLLMRVAVSQ